MRRACNILSAEFYLSIFFSFLIIILFENDIFLSGGWTADKSFEFTVLTIVELVTIICIPLALKLFNFKQVNSQLTTGDNREERLISWGLLRLNMLCLPMIVNILFYYLFMNVAFGYMAIILFLCLFFVIPTKERCRTETAQKK